MSVKAAIIGTHCIGKTTLIKNLQDKVDLPVIHEVARELIRQTGKSIQEMTPEELLQLEKEILNYQLMYEKKYSKTGFISDRSVIDILAYIMAYGIPYYFRDEYEKMVNKIILHLSSPESYDLLFYLPVNLSILNQIKDGVRSTCIHCLFLIDALILQLLETLNPPHAKIIFLKENSLEENVKTILEEIKKHKEGQLWKQKK